MRLGLIAAIVLSFLVSFACTTKTPMPTIEPNIETGKINEQPIRLEFLTRDGCKNTPIVSANFQKAATALDREVIVEVVHQSKLSADDPRIGYPTPTILLNSSDIFGSSRPEPPFPAPS